MERQEDALLFLSYGKKGRWLWSLLQITHGLVFQPQIYFGNLVTAT